VRFSVAVKYLTSEARAKEVVRAIEVLGRPAILCQGDVSEYSAVLAMRERVTAELGPVAILVNSAGVAAGNSFMKMTPAMWRQNLFHRRSAPIIRTALLFNAVVITTPPLYHPEQQGD
jgi:NAD(P)-dependent dehydrogenase (short-subunit alcohol dehydrogenase family)